MATKEKTLDTGERKPLENLGAIKEELETQPAKPVKKRGPRGPYNKKKKAPEPEPMENPIDGQVLENVYSLLFATLANKTGQEHWNLAPEEAKALGEATTAVVDKYLPSLGAFLPELNLTITITGVIGMKFFVSMQIANMQKKAELQEKQQHADDKLEM